MHPPVKAFLGPLLRVLTAPILFWALLVLPTPALSDPADLTGLNSVRFGQAALTFSAGFIRQSLPVDGAVSQITGDTQTTGNKLLLGMGDVTYVKLIKPEEFAPGDQLTLYRRIQEVFHPANKRYLGNLYIMIGLASITRITQDLATVRVVRSYGPITSGDGAMRFVPPAPPEPAPADRTAPDVTGQIVALPHQTLLIGQSNFVYIDRGGNDGFYVGDRLDVFRLGAGLPMRWIGEIKILALEESTATALVVRSTANILSGDRVVFKEPPDQGKRLAQGAAAETLSEELDRLTKSRVEQAAAAPRTSEAGAPPGSLEEQLAALARKLEFEPGEAPVKPAGLPILKQINDLLKPVTDKQITIEGHTDTQPIGPTLKRQFPTNQELSQARAAGMVRYLVEQGGLDPANLSAVGHADRRPLASNSTEEGRKKNRRIEITLAPKPRSPGQAPAPVVPEKAAPKPALPEPEPVLPPVQEPASELPPTEAAPSTDGPAPSPDEPAQPTLPPTAEPPTPAP